MSYECVYCKKNYINKKAYEKHYLKCQSLNSLENDFEVVPSISNIYKLVKHLIKENNSLKKRVNNLEQTIRKNKRNKINILDWLDSKKNIIFDKKYLDYCVFLKSFNENILKFWKNNNYTIGKLNEYSSKDIINIVISDLVFNYNFMISFKSSNKIYCFKNKKWCLLDLDDFYKLYQKIQKKMICDFFDYQKTAELDSIKFNYLSSKIYGDVSKDKNLQEIYNKISKNMSIEIEKEINVKIIY